MVERHFHYHLLFTLNLVAADFKKVEGMGGEGEVGADRWQGANGVGPGDRWQDAMPSVKSEGVSITLLK